MRYYNKLTKNEVEAVDVTDKKGVVTLPINVVELPDDNPFFSALPDGKQLTYAGDGIPNGLEDIPARPAADILAEKLDAYYRECYAFQLTNIDVNRSNEMTKAEALVEVGRATDADLPLAKANGNWLQALWDFHDNEVLSIQAGTPPKSDFLGEVGRLPHGFKAMRTERKTFLAGL